MSKEKYILEYWVDSDAYTEERLEEKVSKELIKLDVDCKIENKRDYFVLTITADQKNIDACHHHFRFDREYIFRAKDELGDELRKEAYPVLAEIETRLRKFITRAMIEVLGFNWWDRSTPNKIRKNVNRIEEQSGHSQVEDHHQIEFTMFDDLITFVTGKYQQWSDTKNILPSDLSEILEGCKSIEELRKKVDQKRQQTSLWNDVFSQYFDDKVTWKELKKEIDEIVIPIRHKVMHHRLIRIHDVRQLIESRDKLIEMIGTAKSKLPQSELVKALESFRALAESAHSQLALNSEIIKSIQKSARLDPEIMKAIKQTTLIDPEVMRKFTSGINFRLQDFDNRSVSDEDNEKDTHGDQENDNNDKDSDDVDTED